MSDELIDKIKRNTFGKAYEKRPLDEICSEQISIDIVGTRCIYINNHRVSGSKPYVSGNLPTYSRKLTIRDVLEAFSNEQLRAFLDERVAMYAYCKGLRDFRDSIEE